jgi:hypothetical protein
MLKEARAVWSGTGTSTTMLVANSFCGKVDFTCVWVREGVACKQGCGWAVSFWGGTYGCIGRLPRSCCSPFC